MHLTDKILHELRKNTGNELKKYCINYLLEIAEDHRKSTVEDLLQYGCVSGMVGELIYYWDTSAFAEKYHEEIWKLIVDQSEEQGPRK